MMEHDVHGIPVCHDLEGATFEVHRKCTIHHVVSRTRTLGAVVKFDA
jgi:hypothetical protein